jgi:hypothetical protein
MVALGGPSHPLLLAVDLLLFLLLLLGQIEHRGDVGLVLLLFWVVRHYCADS